MEFWGKTSQPIPWQLGFMVFVFIIPQFDVLSAKSMPCVLGQSFSDFAVYTYHLKVLLKLQRSGWASELGQGWDKESLVVSTSLNVPWVTCLLHPVPGPVDLVSLTNAVAPTIHLHQYSCLENPHGQGSLAGYSTWGCTVGHNWSDLALMNASCNVCGFNARYLTLNSKERSFPFWSWVCGLSPRKETLILLCF